MVLFAFDHVRCLPERHVFARRHSVAVVLDVIIVVVAAEVLVVVVVDVADVAVVVDAAIVVVAAIAAAAVRVDAWHDHTDNHRKPDFIATMLTLTG